MWPSWLDPSYAFPILTDNNLAVRQRFIVESLKRLCLNPIVDSFDSAFGGKGLNILACINGSTTVSSQHKKYRILSAHYDGPDKVDNASGVLAVLIFAFHLQKNLEEDKYLLFFPDREEVFQEGSKHLIESIELDKVQSFFNVEGIGRGGKVISMRNTLFSLTDYCNKEFQVCNKIFITDASVFTKAGIASYDVFSVPGINPRIVTYHITTETFYLAIKALLHSKYI